MRTFALCYLIVGEVIAVGGLYTRGGVVRCMQSTAPLPAVMLGFMSVIAVWPLFVLRVFR